MNKKSWTFILIILLYLSLFALFIIMLVQIGTNYQELETVKITHIQEEVSMVLNEKADKLQISQKLQSIVNENSMELIVVDAHDEVLFSTFPSIDIKSIRDIFNGEEVLYKSQGVVNTHNGDLNVMLVIYHIAFVEYINSQFIWLTVYITLLFLLLITIITLVNRMLFNPLNNIRNAIHEMKDFDASIIDESTALGTEFKEFVYQVDETLQNASKQYTDLELVLLFEHQRMELLYKISRGSLHELKTPLYQALLQNKLFLESHQYNETAMQYNIVQNDKLLNRINELLKSISDSTKNLEKGGELFDVIDLFYEVEKEFEVLLEQKDTYLSLSSSENTMVYQNKFAVQLIIHNILSNAIKYVTIDGEIDVDIIVLDKSVQFICVNDAENDHITRLQTGRFLTDVENETINQTYSSGNGVYLVKELSKSLGGKTDIEIIENKAKITVTIPQNNRR